MFRVSADEGCSASELFRVLNQKSIQLRPAEIDRKIQTQESDLSLPQTGFQGRFPSHGNVVIAAYETNALPKGTADMRPFPDLQLIEI